MGAIFLYIAWVPAKMYFASLCLKMWRNSSSLEVGYTGTCTIPDIASPMSRKFHSGRLGVMVITFVSFSSPASRIAYAMSCAMR